MVDEQHSPLVFLCGHRKSGTTLLANLLDDHPQLAVYPNDLALLYAYFPAFVRDNVEPETRRGRLERVLFTDLEERLDGLPSASRFEIPVLRKAFFEGLVDAELAEPKSLISRLMAGFQRMRGLAPGNVRWGVLKETSAEIYAAEILEWFPATRFIQIMRDPRDNFAALAAGVDRHYGRLGEDRNRTLASLLHRARLGFRMARCNLSAFGGTRYHVLRFEDLVSEPDTTMKAVASFLDIEFHPRLLVPTVLGQRTPGNSYDGEAKFDVDASNVGRWRERITPQEAQTIEFHMREEMVEFGYAPASEPAAQAAAAAEFYKWQNYAFFYGDRFAEPARR